MKKFLLVLCVCGLCAQTAYADYYRASGGGVYELYVDDCSATGMRRALDNATAARHAVITSVKCAAPRKDDRQIISDIYLETVPMVTLCPCDCI